MGTSSQFGGVSSGLVPSWVDDPSPAPAESPNGTNVTQEPPKDTTHTPTSPSSFQGAKSSYSQYLGSGDKNSMRSALKSYGKGTGGSGGATRRMGTSRSTASGLVHFISAVGTNGTQQALKEFNLSHYTNQPASDILFALSEIICPPGGTIDEAIARNAMHDSIGELIMLGVTDLDSINKSQREELLINFFSNSIKGRIINDIGHGTIKMPSNNEEVHNLEQSLFYFIKNNVRVAVERHFMEKPVLNEHETSYMVDNIYQESFALLTELAEVME